MVKLCDSPALPGGSFRGYQLDPAGNPAFMVGAPKGGTLLDRWEPASGGLKRTLSFSGSSSSEPVEILLTDSVPLKENGPEHWQLGDRLNVEIDHAVLESRDSSTFLKITPGQPATVTYTWR